MKTDFSAFFEKKSEGSVLVVAVMVLVILTLIGIAATNTSYMEQGMAANDVCIKKAFYCSESGLNVGEHMIGYVYVSHDFPTASSSKVGVGGNTKPELENAWKMINSNPETSPPPTTLPILNVPLYDSNSGVTFFTSGVTKADGTQDEWNQDGSVPPSYFRPFTFIATCQSQCGATYVIEARSNIFVPKGN
ncbi:MAG: hypothetical protein EHM45_11145 [Desulfobacteraceae bacterium]|nr:MAG: hypothetical protein EHM45_11145 [Desulfobacteraceae bacterium]